MNIGFLEDPSDFIIFLGRIHPLVVHLPIGFLIIAIIAQFSTRKPKFKALEPYIPYAWGLGAISAIFAVVFGYFLSLSGDYDTDTLFWHKWIGVGVLLFSIACYYTTKKATRPLFFSKWVFTILTTVSIFITGHLGGNLTHGSTYLLEYAPNFVRNVAGMPDKKEPRPKVTEIDSADVFLDMVLPMMEQKCISCHNDGKKKGGLKLDTYANMMKGGESGEAIVVGNASESELYNRITLPEDHDDFMPSEGKRPLSETEVELIEWWIVNNAPKEGYFTKLEPNKKILNLAKNYFGLNKTDQFYAQEIMAPDYVVIDTLAAHGIVVNHLMKENNFLDANLSLLENPIQIEDLDLLLQLKEQLIWLNASNTNLEDDHLEKIGQLQNLLRLDISNNKITDNGLKYLSNLIHLESLNIYNNDVGNEITNLIPKLKSLKKIYLWQTKVSSETVANIKKDFPDLIVVSERE